LAPLYITHQVLKYEWPYQYKFQDFFDLKLEKRHYGVIDGFEVSHLDGLIDPIVGYGPNVAQIFNIHPRRLENPA